MNQFQEMATYIAVVEATNISAAARRLGTTKSVVSRRIQQLESRLGIVLFERGKQLGLTDAGQTFYHRSVQLLADLAQTEEAVRTEHTSLHGRLRLTAPMAFSVHYLAPLLAEFMLQYPLVQLDAEYSDSYANLHQENYDIAIRIGPLPDSELVAQRICTNRHLICASPAYLARRGTPTDPNQLYQHDGLLYIQREPNGMLQLPVNGHIQSFRIGRRLRTDNAFHLLAAAKAGLGLAILPAFMAVDAVAAGDLQIVLPAYSPDGGDISAVYRRSKRASPKIQALTRFLSEHIGQPPRWELAILPYLQAG